MALPKDLSRTEVFEYVDDLETGKTIEQEIEEAELASLNLSEAYLPKKARKRKKVRRYVPKQSNMSKLEYDEYIRVLSEIDEAVKMTLRLKEDYKSSPWDRDAEAINYIIAKVSKRFHKRIRLFKTISYKSTLYNKLTNL